MNRKHISLIAALLTLVMLMGVFSACGNSNAEAESQSATNAATSTETETKGDATTESAGETTAETTVETTQQAGTETSVETNAGSESETGDETGSETGVETGAQSGSETSATTTVETTETTEKDTSPKLEGEYAEFIENADNISNTISAYFTDGDRSGYEITNMNMVYTYGLFSDGDISATLSNKQGGVYLQNTMDVFVRMKDTGKTYYSSKSTSDARGNSFRYGFYYYDVRLLDHDFINTINIDNVIEFEMPKITTDNLVQMKGNVKNNAFIGQITQNVDPQVRWVGLNYDTTQFNALEFTVKVEQSTQMEIFIVAGDRDKWAFAEDQKTRIDVVPDGKEHTYVIPFDVETIKDFYGTLKALRFDFNGYPGEKVEISNVKFIKRSYDDAPALYLDRTLHAYPDKLHQVAHVVAGYDTSNIDTIGMLTEISADTVAKIIVKDAAGLHETLEGVDWATAEYVGFDIIGAGIFGYIMPADNKSGSLEVTLSDGIYSIIQTKSPENGTIYAPVEDTSNDFYMGQRIYTDTEHDFTKFLIEAEIERNPLKTENFVIDSERSSKESVFNGYDALRGSYKFTLPPNVSFQDSYDNRFNEHNNVMFTVTGDSFDRNIYVLAYAYTTDIEHAVILDKNEMLLPVSVEVCKNFKHEHEEPRFDKGDIRYSDAIFPMIVRAEQSQTVKIIHLYQNWGKNPLKQLSSIQCFAPYYHLSTGTTETNCITNQYVYGKDLFVLPDHRAMSAPMWAGQPQHTAGGYHHFLQYTDSEGNYSASENIDNYIHAYGPTYAELALNYISDDGRIKVTYTHMEMPQTDENRAYYTMNYEVLEDISFKNFATDFSFYKASAYQGTYESIGYLDENNVPQIKPVNSGKTPAVYTLGDQCPYFDSFKMVSGTYMEDYVNLSCLIYNYDINLAEAEGDVRLALVDYNDGNSLSLDLGEITLKKGDTISINMLLVPWGSQESIYDGSNGLAPDDNVRRVRENTLLNPIKAEPVKNCETVESVFVPKVRTTDGKNANFKLTGGADNVVAGTYNVAVRVYGFTTLTVPRILEKTDGGWEEYRVNSATTPDAYGNRHPYDGYGVHYDGDGTYSYSFVVDMTSGQEREFRMIVSGEFKGWTDDDRFPPIEGGEEAPKDPLNVYFDPEELNNAGFVGATAEVKSDATGSFIRYTAVGGRLEAYTHAMPVIGADPTGQYIVIRYRIPADTPANTDMWFLEVMSSTTSNEPGLTNRADRPGVIADGEWHLAIYDMTAFATSKEYLPDDEGNYYAKFVRFDFYNPADGKTEFVEGAYIDIAYVGISDSLEKIYEINSDIVDGNGNDLNGPEVIPQALPFYNGADKLISAAAEGIGNKVVMKEGDEEFVRFYGNGTSGESRITVFNTTGNATGQYAVIKYRIPTPADPAAYEDKVFDIFTSTVNTAPTGNDVAYFSKVLTYDEWVIIVVDISKFTKTNSAFSEKNGEYTANFLAFDCFNKATATSSYIDIAYIGMTDDLADVEALAAGVGQYTLIVDNVDANQVVVTVAAAE